jgi:hypothetical protein
LKLSVASVGHVNSRGKIMYLCMALGVSRWKGRGEVGVGTLAHRCLLEISISIFATTKRSTHLQRPPTVREEDSLTDGTQHTHVTRRWSAVACDVQWNGHVSAHVSFGDLDVLDFSGIFGIPFQAPARFDPHKLQLDRLDRGFGHL